MTKSHFQVFVEGERESDREKKRFKGKSMRFFFSLELDSYILKLFDFVTNQSQQQTTQAHTIA